VARGGFSKDREIYPDVGLAIAGWLHAIDSGELGEVARKRLIHLQCHFGLDTLILAGAGAIATGLDISPAAIAEARRLAAEIGVDFCARASLVALAAVPDVRPDRQWRVLSAEGRAFLTAGRIIARRQEPHRANLATFLYRPRLSTSCCVGHRFPAGFCGP
jgi:hypothetical protein